MKTKWAGVIFLLIMLAVTVLVILSNEKTVTIGKLSDGSHLVLEKVSYGQYHEYPKISNLKYGLARFLPKNFRKKVNVLAFSSGTNFTLGLWVHRVKPTKTPLPVVRVISLGDGVLGDTRNSRAGQPTKTGQMQGFEILNFPRRSEMITLKFQEGTGPLKWSEIGTIEIKNNSPIKKFATWKPESLPSQRVVQGHSFELQHLGYFEGTNSLEMIGRYTVAKFKAPSGWNVASKIKLTDPTGNQANIWWVSAENGSPRNSLDLRSITCLGGLGTNEPAWKVQVQFYKDLNNIKETVELEWIVAPARLDHL